MQPGLLYAPRQRTDQCSRRDYPDIVQLGGGILATRGIFLHAGGAVFVVIGEVRLGSPD